MMRKRKRVSNPHDAFFRRTMSRPRAVAEFLRLYLPSSIVARLDLSLVHFEYHLCDLSRYRDEELAGNEGLSAALKLLKYIFRRELPEKLPSIFRELADALPEQEVATQVETMVSYLTEAQRVSENQISKALFEAAEGGRMETVLDKMRQQWRREGHREGRQEGQRKGKQIGAAEVTLGQLRLKVGRLNRTTVEQVQALPVASLKRLGKALLRFQSRADLDAWLRRSAAQSARKL